MLISPVGAKEAGLSGRLKQEGVGRKWRVASQPRPPGRCRLPIFSRITPYLEAAQFAFPVAIVHSLPLAAYNYGFRNCPFSYPLQRRRLARLGQQTFLIVLRLVFSTPRPALLPRWESKKTETECIP